jgi:uncharacterized integral membrane protein (TIGR00698 family)
MNIHHVLSKYHKADAASIAIPELKKKLEEINSSGVAPEAVSAIEKKIRKHQKALTAVNGKVEDRWSWATFLYVNCQFNYVAMLLIGGIIIRNTIGVHNIFLPGIGIARPFIKPGIIILGVHYVWSDVVKVGGVGLGLTAVFIFGTAITVMYISKKFGVSDGLGGIMGAGTGVCGVSAIIATAPVVKAKPRDMAYAIGTILLFGTLMLFALPYLGKLFNVSQAQFGAWDALAILNTAQLIAAAEWYGEGARDTAVLINAARIMLIPFVVLYAVWFYGLRDDSSSSMGAWTTVKDKFPIFILGFFALVLLNSINIATLGGPKTHGTPFWAMDAVYKWFFALGFAGIGLSISIADMKEAGGKAFVIGCGAATVKMTLGLIAVLLIGAGMLTVTGGH